MAIQGPETIMPQTKTSPQLTPGQRLDAVVFIETSQGRKHLHRLGAAFINSNGTIGIVLNSLPFDRRFCLLPIGSTSQGPLDEAGPLNDPPAREGTASTAPAESPEALRTAPRRRRVAVPRNEP